MSPVINTRGGGTSLGKIKGRRFEILQFLFGIVKNLSFVIKYFMIPLKHPTTPWSHLCGQGTKLNHNESTTNLEESK
jgi:hypothetical protein